MSAARESFAYPKNIRFQCTKCTLCCGDAKTRVRHILMLEKEARRISKITSKPVEVFAYKAEGKEPYFYEMRKTEDGKCLFLEKKKCTIYMWRPLICQYYPFQLKMTKSDSHVFSFTAECPGMGAGKRLKRDYFERLFRLARRRIASDSSESRGLWGDEILGRADGNTTMD